MQNMSSIDSNIYKILDLVGSCKENEIKKYRDNLTEEEKKIYDCCVKTLQAENPRSRSYKLLLDAIHSKTTGQEIEGEICGDFFCSHQVQESKLQKMIGQVRDAAASPACFSTLLQKIEEKPVKSDLAAQFADVKETEPFNDFMHRIFLTTNEEDHPKILEELKKEPIHGNTFMEMESQGGQAIIGVSGFAALNMVAIRGEEASGNTGKIDTLIIIDRSAKVGAFWKAMQEIITSSQTRHEVLEKLDKLVHSEMFAVKDLPSNIKYEPLDDLHKEVTKDLSWLSSTRRFKKVKDIFDSGRFIFKCIDITDEQAMQSLQEALEKSKCVVDTLYVSNISEYLEPSEFEAYKNGLMKVIDDKTLLVDTAPRDHKDKPLKQRVIKNSMANLDKLAPSPLTLYTKRVKESSPTNE
jgi:hypothetical protein